MLEADGLGELTSELAGRIPVVVHARVVHEPRRRGHVLRAAADDRNVHDEHLEPRIVGAREQAAIDVVDAAQAPAARGIDEEELRRLQKELKRWIAECDANRERSTCPVMERLASPNVSLATD